MHSMTVRQTQWGQADVLGPSSNLYAFHTAAAEHRQSKHIMTPGGVCVPALDSMRSLPMWPLTHLQAGLLANVLQVLTANGCAVRSAAVWTHNHRCAFVISVLDQSSAPQPLTSSKGGALSGAAAASTSDVTVAGGTVRGGAAPNNPVRTGRSGRMAQPQASLPAKGSAVTQDPVKLARLLEHLKAMMDSKQQVLCMC
jgi:hypothetical protein